MVNETLQHSEAHSSDEENTFDLIDQTMQDKQSPQGNADNGLEKTAARISEITLSEIEEEEARADVATAPEAASEVGNSDEMQERTRQLLECLNEIKKLDTDMQQLQQQMLQMQTRQEELRSRLQTLEAGEKSADGAEKDEEEKAEEEKEEEVEERKRTMAEMGYHFKDGKLCKIDGSGGFTFTTQKEYEELGDLIGEAVYEMMEEAGLERRYLEEGHNRRFYFVSPGYEHKNRVLVLIHGSGVVKAGQWARRLIINESLSRGTQLDYIKRGLANDWGVVVLNYNEMCKGAKDRCHGPDAHGMAEWAHAINPDVDGDILVVAHSAGGEIVSGAVRRMLHNRDYRVLAVALTDSWFSEGNRVFAVNFNTQQKLLHVSNGTYQMYSGDDTHEGTSAACFNSLFAILEGVSHKTSEKDFVKLLNFSEGMIIEQHKEKRRKELAKHGDSAKINNAKEQEGKKATKRVANGKNTGEKVQEEEKEEKEEDESSEEESESEDEGKQSSEESEESSDDEDENNY